MNDDEDIHQRIFRYEAARAEEAQHANLSKMPEVLRVVEQKRRRAHALLQRLNYPRQYTGAIYPVTIDRYGKAIAAWRLDNEYDDGYQTESWYLTADGDVVDYMEELKNPPFEIPNIPYTYQSFEQSLDKTKDHLRYKRALDLSRRLDFLIRGLEEIDRR